MKRTITETFDKDGRVTRRITVEEEENPIQPLYPAPYPMPYPVPSIPYLPTPYDPLPRWPIITCGGTNNLGTAIQ
jgi:hypothetical protein